MNNNKTYFFIQFTIYQFLETIFFYYSSKGRRKNILLDQKTKQMNVWESFKREENENCHKIFVNSTRPLLHKHPAGFFFIILNYIFFIYFGN